MVQKQILLSVIVLVAAATAPGQESAFQQAWRLADEARGIARSEEGERAVELYIRALELAPEAVEIRRDYATVLGWLERHEEASRQFAAVFEQEPNQPAWAVREMANAHFFGGNEAGALWGFDALIAEGYHEEAVLTRRGLTLLRLDRVGEAEEQYRQALGWYPESETAAVGLGRALARQGRSADAYTLAVTWGAKAAPDSEIRVFAAEMLSALGRHQEAAAAYGQISPDRLREAGLAEAALAARRLAGLEAVTADAEPPVRQALSPPIGTGSPDTVERAQTLHELGVRTARDGDVETGLRHLETALSITPDNIDLIRDYAIVLGWAERYGESLEHFERVLARRPEQPAWARSELARNQLFGGRTVAALDTLNDLMAEGLADLGTLSRRGLALRWLGRSEEASAAYRRLSSEFPDSPEGPRGLVQALADRNHLSDALRASADGLKRFPDDTELKIRRAQVLNWAGRHVQARRVLEELPPALWDTSDVLQHRTLAARWASRPREAFALAQQYRRQHPENPQSERLLRELSHEYGASLQAEAEGVSDSAGYSYRSTGQRATIPLSTSHRLSFQREHRRYEDSQSAPGSLEWDRYGAGWTGVLGRRVTGSANIASIDYGLAGASRRMVGDVSASALLTDRVRAAAGFGVAPAETLPALQERLTGRHVWGEVGLRPTLKIEAGARYTRRDFSGAAMRQSAELSAFRMISQRGGHKIRVGARSQWMWHDRYTPLFWSPEFFYTQLASFRMEGSLPGRVDYAGEIGSGIQREAGYERQFPLVTTIEIAKKLQPQIWLRFKAGYSNSSIDRVNTGVGAYRLRYFSAGLDFRLGKKTNK